MKKKLSVNWGKWLREPKQQRRIIEEIQKVSRLSGIWAVTTVVVMILLVSAGILINYFAGLRTSANIDAFTRQMLDANKTFIQKSLAAINPNDFLFKPFDDSDWYTPTPVNEYVKLHIIPVQSKKISLTFSVKNRSEYPARDVNCMILFSSEEFVESGNDIVKSLENIGGLNTYTANSSNDYLNEAAAFEWSGIPPKTQKSMARNIDLTMKGNTGRISVRINSVNRLAFEFRHNGD